MEPSRRDILRTAPLAALANREVWSSSPTHPRSSPKEAKPKWYRSLLVGMEIGPTGANDKDSIYMSQANGAEWVRALGRAGAQYGVIFMKDQNFAYYNSRIAQKCPNLGSRDLLSECVTAGQREGIPIIAYCQIQYDTSAWAAHPDWRMKDVNGKDIKGRLCYNSAYFEYNRQIAAEMLEYGISGFHFDMLDFGFGPPVGCWCEHCQTAFEQQHGTNLPHGTTWDGDWDKMLQFRCDSNTHFCQKLQDSVHKQRPGVSVDFNYHGYPPFSWYPGEKPVEHAKNGDFVTAEGLPWVFGNYNPSLLSLFMEGARLGGPIQVATSRSVYNYHDFTLRPTADMEWEVFTYMAHGAQCTIVDKANYDGTLDGVVYERIGRIFRAARDRGEYFGQTPVQDVGLYYSSRSRDWYGRTDTEKYTAAFCGAHKALVQAHIAFGTVMQENASDERLQQFPVIYVPNAAILSPQEVEKFTRYVEGGGKLLITGLTGLYDLQGNLQEMSSIADLAGVRLQRVQQDFPDNYLRLPSSLANGAGRFLTADIACDWPILTWAPIALYEPNGAEAFGELLVAYRSLDNSWSRHMSPDKVAGSAVFIHQRGKGKVVLVPCMPDTAYIQRYRMPEHRNLLRNLVCYLNPTPVVQIEAPASVEAVVTRDSQKNRLLIHLISFSAPPTATSAPFDKGREVLPPSMEEPMHYEARIQIRHAFSEVKCVGNQSSAAARGTNIHLVTREVHALLMVQL